MNVTSKMKVTNMPFTLLLPYPPTINHYYGQTKCGRKYIRKDGRRYRELVAHRSKQFGYKTNRNCMGALILNPPDNRRRDVDNIQKCTLDALEKSGIVVNDSQFKGLLTVMAEPLRPGGLEVIIYELPEKYTNMKGAARSAVEHMVRLLYASSPQKDFWKTVPPEKGAK